MDAGMTTGHAHICDAAIKQIVFLRMLLSVRVRTALYNVAQGSQSNCGVVAYTLRGEAFGASSEVQAGQRVALIGTVL
jgi:hypothetical protein